MCRIFFGSKIASANFSAARRKLEIGPNNITVSELFGQPYSFTIKVKCLVFSKKCVIIGLDPIIRFERLLTSSPTMTGLVQNSNCYGLLQTEPSPDWKGRAAVAAGNGGKSRNPGKRGMQIELSGSVG